MTSSSMWSPRGRASRRVFALRLMLIGAAVVLAGDALPPPIGASVLWLIHGAALWILTCACVQRLHDRGRSGFWLLSAVVPVVGLLWLVAQVLGQGTSGENRWGTDPTRKTGDFLVVN